MPPPHLELVSSTKDVRVVDISRYLKPAQLQVVDQNATYQMSEDPSVLLSAYLVDDENISFGEKDVTPSTSPTTECVVYMHIWEKLPSRAFNALLEEFKSNCALSGITLHIIHRPIDEHSY